MEDFEITLPQDNQISIDVTNPALYNYDFSSFSLAPLQKAAGSVVTNKLKSNLFSHVSEARMIKRLVGKGDTEYVADLSDYAKERLNSGEWKFGIRKNTGETYAVIRDTKSGQIKSYANLKSKEVKSLGNLPELSAIQNQLAQISEQIEDLNQLVARVEQGQYNDRFAGFFSARQMIVEALVTSDEDIQKVLLTSAIKINNETIGKLMLSTNQDVNEFIDLRTKPKDAERIDNLLQTSIGYLNSSVQLNVVAYSALGEEQSLLATLLNYQSFINQVLLKKADESGRTVAWKIDNAHKGSNGKFDGISQNISQNITLLVDNVQKNRIGVYENEKIGQKDL